MIDQTKTAACPQWQEDYHGELGPAGDSARVGPQNFRTTCLLDDGTAVSFRPVRPTDEPLMENMWYALSRETRYYRFMSWRELASPKQIHDFVHIDQQHAVGIVGTTRGGRGSYPSGI